MVDFGQKELSFAFADVLVVEHAFVLARGYRNRVFEVQQEFGFLGIFLSIHRCEQPILPLIHRIDFLRMLKQRVVRVVSFERRLMLCDGHDAP